MVLVFAKWPKEQVVALLYFYVELGVYKNNL
jgi:hypothetical protein